jgi:hypothetical protein
MLTVARWMVLYGDVVSRGVYLVGTVAWLLVLYGDVVSRGVYLV